MESVKYTGGGERYGVRIGSQWAVTENGEDGWTGVMEVVVGKEGVRLSAGRKEVSFWRICIGFDGDGGVPWGCGNGHFYGVVGGGSSRVTEFSAEKK